MTFSLHLQSVTGWNSHNVNGILDSIDRFAAASAGKLEFGDLDFIACLFFELHSLTF
jgi:hypothetical protein